MLNRNIDKINGVRAKVVDIDGDVYIGEGYQPCVATDKDGDDVDGICFKCDDGREVLFAEDDIASVELL